MILRTTLKIAVLALLLPVGVLAQGAKPDAAKKPAKTPDTLVFSNGEQLTGELETASADGITFKSAMAGEIKVPWKNIKELRSDKEFALLTKGERLTRKSARAVVPEGKVSADDKMLTVATATGPKVVPIADANLLVDGAAFDKAVNHPPGFFHGFGGTAQGGVALVRSTQNSTTFNGGINLVRATPEVSWLPARTRTVLDYNQSYGTVSQPGTTPATPTIETNVFHADAEQDQYFSPRAFVFGSATFDHNFSSQLDLQQAYGAGLGLTLLKNAHRQLDLKGDAHYEKQRFFNSALNPTFIATTQNQNLFGSTFSEKYLRYLRYGLVLNEFGSFSPSWFQSNSSATQPNAYSGHVNATLGFPLFKGIGFNIGAVDDYVNNAPAGSKRNTSQFTTNLTYTIKPK
jgi:hypothetical protein